MTVPSVSMKSALGTAHPAPVNGGYLALGPGHVTLRHLPSSSLPWSRRRARHARASPSRVIRSVPGSLAGGSISYRHGGAPCAGMRGRAPFARALAVVAGQAQDLESSGEA